MTEKNILSLGMMNVLCHYIISEFIFGADAKNRKRKIDRKTECHSRDNWLGKFRPKRIVLLISIIAQRFLEQ